jgi:hypothetical protein
MLAISPKPVIIILMKIEKEFEENHNINASEAMEACMGQISEILIEPMMEMEMINKEQQMTLGLIAEAFYIITRKAQAYEKMQEGNLPQEFRN